MFWDLKSLWFKTLGGFGVWKGDRSCFENAVMIHEWQVAVPNYITKKWIK